MKKLILLPALFIVLTAGAQSVQYKKIEVTHFTKERDITSKLIKYKPGKIVISGNSINIEGQPSLTFAYKGATEAEDELYTSQTYVCISEGKNGLLRALKCVLFFTPKHELCDVVVKIGNTNTDYCITDK